MARLNLRWRRRVPYVPQMEAAECGVACLAMVLAYHGAEQPLAMLRKVCAVGRDGVSAAKIYRAAQQFGLTPGALRIEPDQLAAVALPAIAHWEFNHFVVVSAFDRKGVSVMDPASGERRLSQREFSAAFTGVLLTFSPNADFAPRRQRSESLQRVLATVRGLRGAGFALLASVFLLELLSLLLPAANQVLIDHVLVPQRPRWLPAMLIAVASCAFATTLTTALRDRVAQRLNFAADVELATAFTERLLRLPLSFFELRSSGDLMQRVEAQRAIRDALARSLSGFLDALLLLGYATLMLAYHSRIGAIILAMSAACCVLVVRSQRAVRQAAASEMAAAGREAHVTVEALSAPELVRACGAEERLMERHEQRFLERQAAELDQRLLGERAAQLSSAADSLAQIALLALAGAEVLADRMSLGVLAGLLTLQAALQKPLRALVDCAAMLGKARAGLARVDDVFVEAPLLQGNTRSTRYAGALVAERMTFRHEGQAPLYRELELSIRPGETVAVVGRSGQGKSTLLRLFAGLIAPSEGRVLLDGVDLRAFSRAELAKRIGVVLQDPFLLDDTVRVNLTIGVPEASEEDLRAATRIACIDERIASLRDGLETRLGSQGSRLSGGERQRLALARALVRKPCVLLLDEATSALDRATEQRLQTNLMALRCTRLIVAHRLDTVRAADRILVVEDGAIVQQGTFDSLCRVRGPFAALAQTLASAP